MYLNITHRIRIGLGTVCYYEVRYVWEILDSVEGRFSQNR